MSAHAASAPLSGPIDPAALSVAQKVFAFASMCVGMFIVLFDIQIVSASLREGTSIADAATTCMRWFTTTSRSAPTGS